MNTSTSPMRGSSSAAIVAILALVLLAGAAYLIWFRGDGDGDDVIIQEERHVHEIEDDGPNIEIDLLPGEDDADRGDGN